MLRPRHKNRKGAPTYNFNCRSEHEGCSGSQEVMRAEKVVTSLKRFQTEKLLGLLPTTNRNWYRPMTYRLAQLWRRWLTTVVDLLQVFSDMRLLVQQLTGLQLTEGVARSLRATAEPLGFPPVLTAVTDWSEIVKRHYRTTMMRDLWTRVKLWFTSTVASPSSGSTRNLSHVFHGHLVVSFAVFICVCVSNGDAQFAAVENAEVEISKKAMYRKQSL